MSALRFDILSRARGGGRTGRLTLAHGIVETPAFMPVGTYGSVRGVTPRQLRTAGTQMVLANAYHLALRPGAATVAALGGIQRFMGWNGPVLTDSGGFQVFSLADTCKVDEQGAVFRSPIDGAKLRLTPESVVALEETLGVDIGMVFDLCIANPGDRSAAAAAAGRTLRWAERARAVTRDDSPTAIFAIQQGGLFEDLRRENSEGLVALDFPGYAVGGLSVGEERAETMRTAEFSVRMLPDAKPRYMMGMGTPLDLVDLCGWGYDLFDCVLPTRNGRNGSIFTADGTISIRNACHRASDLPLEEGCECEACIDFSRGYLHHLAKRGEMLAAILASVHNVSFYQRLMRDIRTALASDAYEGFRTRFRARYEGELDG
ncbi:MAG TPA: tRNA guanosine(34) transglycosylase Tgt [Candidatus Limnocylindrales bacterium]|nr:tRNA guanosine(34) transglycosylase Tgt [Candidatus Limnocylindrales bacterium]